MAVTGKTEHNYSTAYFNQVAIFEAVHKDLAHMCSVEVTDIQASTNVHCMYELLLVEVVLQCFKHVHTIKIYM